MTNSIVPAAISKMSNQGLAAAAESFLLISGDRLVVGSVLLRLCFVAPDNVVPSTNPLSDQVNREFSESN